MTSARPPIRRASRLASAAILCSAAAGATAALSPRQLTLLATNCVQCHATPGLGAPLIGDKASWERVRQRGEEAAMRSVLKGTRGMPPLGYCSACSEMDFRALIRFLADMPESPQPDLQR